MMKVYHECNHTVATIQNFIVSIFKMENSSSNDDDNGNDKVIESGFKNVGSILGGMHSFSPRHPRSIGARHCCLCQRIEMY